MDEWNDNSLVGPRQNNIFPADALQWCNIQLFVKICYLVNFQLGGINRVGVTWR